MIRRIFQTILGLALLVGAIAGPAMAQERTPAELTASIGKSDGEGIGIVADLSTHTVAIRTDFAGTRVLLFGALVRSREEGKARPGIVVVIRGPENEFRMHRKRRKLGVWVNADERVFPRAPGYYAILATSPLERIAPAEALRKAGIGFDQLKEELIRTGQGFASPQEAAEYADGFIRLQTQRRLYQEDPQGVKMVGRYLFRARFDLPANVPLGTYHARVYLFREGRLLGTYEAPLTIEKKGFEQFIYDLAHERPFIYGVVAVVIAMAAGFLANAVFRKD